MEEHRFGEAEIEYLSGLTDRAGGNIFQGDFHSCIGRHISNSGTHHACSKYTKFFDFIWLKPFWFSLPFARISLGTTAGMAFSA